MKKKKSIKDSKREISEILDSLDAPNYVKIAHKIGKKSIVDRFLNNKV
mgnify:CR=1 FL=1